MTTTDVPPVVTGGRRPQPRRRRVLWVIKGLGRGGAEQLTVTGARTFDRSRWTIEVAYVLPHKDTLVDDLRRAGVAVHCVGAAGSGAAWVRALRRLITTGGYDLVHTHSPLPSVVVRTISANRRPPVVHTEHNLWPRYRPLTRAANAATFGRNAASIAVSEGVAASMTGPLGTPRVAVLHHGIDVTAASYGPVARAAARATLGLPATAPVVGTVATFTPKKDHATLLAAVAGLVPAHPDLRVVLVGGGPREDDVRARVAELGLRDTVVFAGVRDDVPRILPAFDAFALSSRYEGLPIALLEAMASGVAPVATAVGGVPEVITDKVDGLLVPAGRPDLLAAGIGHLLEDRDLRSRLAAAARTRAADFDITRAVRRMERWYEEIVA